MKILLNLNFLKSASPELASGSSGKALSSNPEKK
jgi:hypothetical protein